MRKKTYVPLANLSSTCRLNHHVRLLGSAFAYLAVICGISMALWVESALAQPDTSKLPTDSIAASPTDQAASPKEVTKFDSAAAFEFLKQVCEIGPRVSGTKGMFEQQKLLEKHFQSVGGAVFYQSFYVKHPQDGRQIELKNQLVRWHPNRDKRLLICCHYDTRPYPDRDPVNPRGTFIGANDGGSGVGLLCELGKHIQNLNGPYGVDFVFFDGEEFVYVSRRDEMFLGSTEFSKAYAEKRIRANYVAGVLVDMVADKNLQIYYEGNSLRHAPRVTRDLWAIAGKLGIKEFVAKRRHNIRDDHLPLNQIARIPVCDIIDFDFPVDGNGYWHTEKDVVSNCSAESLGKVGTVVLEWLREMQTRK